MGEAHRFTHLAKCAPSGVDSEEAVAKLANNLRSYRQRYYQPQMGYCVRECGKLS